MGDDNMRLLTGALIAMMAVANVQAEGWDRTLSAGANLTSGNSDTMLLGTSVEAARNGEKHEQRYSITANYGENKLDGDNLKTVGNAKGQAEYKYKIDNSYVYANNSVFHDSVAEIDYQLILGGGGGYYLLHSETAKLGVELGLAYIHEELANNSKSDDVAIRLAARHDQTLSETAKLWVATEYLPQIDDFKNYLLNSEAGIEAVLNTSLSLRVALLHRYDSDVPEGRDKSDVSLISSLVYKL